MSRTITEYRIRVTREGCRPKDHFRLTRGGMERLLTLLGPEPWRAYTDADPDSYLCCSGWECGCQGVSIRDEAAHRREGMPPVERIDVSRRTVVRHDWEPCSALARVSP